MAEHNDRGRMAEDLASEYLALKGYRINCRNWRFRQKELDIIAEKDNELVIVEVKSCFGKDTFTADELLTKGKMRFLADAAEAYIQRYNISLPARFDLIVISHPGNTNLIEHIEGAFIPGVNW